MLKYVFAAVVLLLCQPVWAEEIKIGFVNVARVLQQAPQAEKAKKRLEREFAPRDKRLVAMQKELQKLEEKLARDAAVMSDSERRKLEREILAKQRELKRAREEFREDFNLRRNEELGKLQRQVFEAIKSLAKEESYDLLLTDGVVYASDKVDVTAKILKRLQDLAK
ncbi:MAG TPA: OmpH family outer membrane protein [Devosia sp.]|nr:OmpH family outer membrane protein [Devosia sp.]